MSASRSVVGSVASRLVAYTIVLVVVAVVGFATGTIYFEATECSGPDFDGECDLAALGGVLWAFAAVVLGLVVILVGEVVGGVRHRRRSGTR